MNRKSFLLGALLLTSVTTAFAAVGDYKTTDCSPAYFTSNNCSACFDGGSISQGTPLTGLYDSWSNKNQSEQIVYKDEQTMPEMVALSAGTTFTANPIDPTAFWKFGSSVIWTDSVTGTGKQEFMLEAGKTVKFLESDLGASYILSATDKANGEAVGILKFPINYHNVDIDGNEGNKETYIECVAYTANVATVAVTPVEVVIPAPQQPTPEPKQMTKVKTGPESSLILLSLALIISAGFIVVRSRKA